MNNKIKYGILITSIILLIGVSGYIYCPYFNKNSVKPKPITQLPQINQKTKFELSDVKDYNFYNFNPIIDEYKKRNIYIVANIFESSFKNINEMIPYTKAIVHIVPIFNNNNESMMKTFYCNESTNAGKNIYYYIKYKISYNESTNCNFLPILTSNKNFKDKYLINNLPMVIFDSGDQTKLNISESDAKSNENLFNMFLNVSSSIESKNSDKLNINKESSLQIESIIPKINYESDIKSTTKKNSGGNISLIKSIKTENIIESNSKTNNIMHIIESGLNNKETTQSIKQNQPIKIKYTKFVIIGESYPNLYRVSLFTKLPIEKLKTINKIKNENDVIKNTKIYY